MKLINEVKFNLSEELSNKRVPIGIGGIKGGLIIVLLMISTLIIAQNINLQPIVELQIAEKIGQFRSVPVKLDGKNAICGMYSEDAEIDPYIGMFFFPKHTLKLILFDEKGEILWKRDLGGGVVPGVWFSPIYAMDLDKDGNDEIWIVNNQDPEHPMDYRKYVLEKIDPKSGKEIGQWKWNEPAQPQSMSSTFRHFIFGGYVKGEPVLITAQGTYGPMSIQAWNPDMTLRWEYNISKDAKGSIGAHVTPVVDINNDGIDDILWGERCIEMDTGKELFCAAENSWEGHSDIIQPVLDWKNNKWYFHTCRESFNEQAPRLVFYDENGEQVWGDVNAGHMDTGWAARLGENGEPIVLGVKVGEKIRTAEGERRTGVVEYTYEAISGKKIDLGFNVYTTIPVDLNGDGIHELVKGYFEGDGTVIDNSGKVLGNVGGLTAMASKFTSLPGEQILSYSKDGKIIIWADINAKDNNAAKRRYNHPYYKVNQYQTGNGYNLFTLGGI